jgi:hypothetical protein
MMKKLPDQCFNLKLLISHRASWRIQSGFGTVSTGALSPQTKCTNKAAMIISQPP